MGANNHLQDISDSTDTTVGRFAPSPTGPLHFGSLVAAVASYLTAKTKNNSKWLLRIEDVDTQREQQGASESIIQTLESFGFMWDDEVRYQSDHTEKYQTALEKISTYIYPCSCTRKYLQSLSDESTYGYIYPGICRKGINNPDIKNPSIRVKTNNNKICFEDLCQPEIICQNIEQEIGDFILRRRDGLFAYQLAVVVDDALQGINQVVRGSDILDNTPRQIYLQQLLGYPQPEYLHFPTAISNDGKKLSKQNHSPAILTENNSNDKKRDSLLATLEFLGQNPPNRSDFDNLNDLWKWSFQHWNTENIPKVMTKLTEFN